jgi:hypothetical protein
LALLLAMLLAVGFSSIAAANHNTVELISTGPIGGSEASHAFFGDATGDGSKVFFHTQAKLVPEDTDDLSDVYQRSGGVTTLISTDPTDTSNGAGGSFFAGASADGSRVFFESDDNLVSDDTDDCTSVDPNVATCFDVYERSGGTTRIVSGGGDGVEDAAFEGSSQDGTHVFFSTSGSLVAGDTDTRSDVYESIDGATPTLVTAGPSGTSDCRFEAASADGSRVFFSTEAPLTAADEDGNTDVYERSGAAPTLLTGGVSPSPGAFFGGISANGDRLFFTTQEALDLVNDTDESRYDVYQWTDGSPDLTLVSHKTGEPSDLGFDSGFEGSSKDGTRVFFITDEPLAENVPDSQLDIYQRSGADLTKVSPGSGAFNAHFLLASDDGNVVLLDTAEQLVGADDDDARDLYRVVNGGSPTLLSPGAASGSVDVCAPSSSRVPRGCGVLMSADGSRVFFHTTGKLLPADTDTFLDIYEWSGGVVTMLPGSNGGPSNLLDLSDNGDLVFFESQLPLAAGDNEPNSFDVYQGRYVAPVITPPGTGNGTVTPPAAISGTPNLTLKLSGRKTQRILRQGGVVVSFICNNDCQASATGSINVPGASKVFRLGKATKSAKANKTTTLKLKLAGKARSAIKRALKRGKKLRAKVKLTVKDGSGSKTRSLTVSIKR